MSLPCLDGRIAIICRITEQFVAHFQGLLRLTINKVKTCLYLLGDCFRACTGAPQQTASSSTATSEFGKLLSNCEVFVYSLFIYYPPDIYMPASNSQARIFVQRNRCRSSHSNCWNFELSLPFQCVPCSFFHCFQFLAPFLHFFLPFPYSCLYLVTSLAGGIVGSSKKRGNLGQEMVAYLWIQKIDSVFLEDLGYEGTSRC